MRPQVVGACLVVAIVGSAVAGGLAPATTNAAPAGGSVQTPVKQVVLAGSVDKVTARQSPLGKPAVTDRREQAGARPGDPCAGPDVVYNNGSPDYRDGLACEVGGLVGDVWIVNDVLFVADVNITAVHWWGLTTDDYGWAGSADFIVLLPDGPNGAPGTVLFEIPNASAARVFTGSYPWGYPEYQYSITGVNWFIPAGLYWIGVRPVGTTGAGRNFWHTAADNGTQDLYFKAPYWGFNDWTPGVAVFGVPYETAFCLVGYYGEPPVGACCDDLTGVCTDNAAFPDCLPPLRFAANTTCAELTPACGEITGACCYPDGNCDVVPRYQCPEPAIWLGPNTVCAQCPCIVVCPPGGDPEQEPCGEDTNGGCNMAFPTFEPIVCGQTKCGTAWFDGSIRDTDWYQIDLAESMMLTISAEAEFEVVFGLIEQYVYGMPGCENITGWINPYAFQPACSPADVITICLPAGTYYVFVAPSFNVPVNCPADYWLTVTCEPCVIPEGACCFADGHCEIRPYLSCPGYYWGDWTVCEQVYCTGACCFPDTSCMDTTQNDCQYRFMGIGTQCATTVCPQPPPNDYCQDAILVEVPSETFGTTLEAMPDSEFYPCGTSIDSPGVWYKVIGTGNTMTATTCNPYFFTYDTKITVFCGGCSTEPYMCVGGNDDNCMEGNGLLSTVTWCSQAGAEYLILVHGFGGQSGDFLLRVFDDGLPCEFPPRCAPCELECEPGDIAEGEPLCGPEYVDNYNGGCNSTPPVFQPIDPGTTICGESGTYLFQGMNYRDTDWFEYVLTEPKRVTWQAIAEFPLQILIVDGTLGCDNLQIIGGAYAEPCIGASIVLDLDPGTYWFWIGPSVFDGIPCGAQYRATLRCETAGACCLGTECFISTQAICCAQGGRFLPGVPCTPELVYSVDECAEPFEDISSFGTQIFLGDDDGMLVPIGFTFNFFGTDHTEVAFCSNGYLTFGSTWWDYTEEPIPNPNEPNDLIAVLWDDLNPGMGGTLHYATVGSVPDRAFIAQWKDVPQYGQTDRNTFQVVLREGTNCIEFRYASFDTTDYVAGVESPDGTAGTEATALVAPNRCLKLCPQRQLATCDIADMNCDGLVNAFDIDAFVLALVNPAAYQATYPNCNILAGDTNFDGQVNVFDIDGFVFYLNGCP